MQRFQEYTHTMTQCENKIYPQMPPLHIHVHVLQKRWKQVTSVVNSPLLSLVYHLWMKIPLLHPSSPPTSHPSSCHTHHLPRHLTWQLLSHRQSVLTGPGIAAGGGGGGVLLLWLQSKPAHLPRNSDELGRVFGGLAVQQCLQTSAATGLDLERVAQRERFIHVHAVGILS